ncbi:MAG: cyclic nucleotide-binding domain-containing protein [Gammaproteobacteria bacterium]|nr:cyclic nucleotide-binding domain-containing protein [Gammaproteobacteria bacterium]
MSSKENLQIVRLSPLAEDLTDEQCRVLADIVEVRQLKDDESLIREGEKDNSLHVVIKGKLAVTKNSSGDEKLTLHILKVGDLAGAMGFVDGAEHSASLVSLGESEVFSLDRSKLEALLDSNGTLVYQVMRAIVRSVHTILRRMNTQHVELNNYINRQHGRF